MARLTLLIRACRPFTGAWIETSAKRAYEELLGGRPFTGAWIETTPVGEMFVDVARRPFTGAWIETAVIMRSPLLRQVAPSRGRGLKRCKSRPTWDTPTVAPSRGRGLKRALHGGQKGGVLSPLHGGVD